MSRQPVRDPLARAEHLASLDVAISKRNVSWQEEDVASWATDVSVGGWRQRIDWATGEITTVRKNRKQVGFYQGGSGRSSGRNARRLLTR